MEKLVLNEAEKIWKEIGQYKKAGKLKLEVELYKKLLHIFQVGEYYYLIFNPPEMNIEFASKEMKKILGYSPKEFTLELLMGIIHPDDLPFFINFEATVTQFWKNLPPEKVMKYKSRYDYRVRKKDGSYIRVLQQIVTIQSDDEGAVLRTFVVHTDITHLKESNRMVLSFIGLEGEPSFVDVQPVKKMVPYREILSKREKEILQLLAKNHKTREIAELLCISPNTVNTHRKNMLRKTGAGSTVHLISMGLEKGWL